MTREGSTNEAKARIRNRYGAAARVAASNAAPGQECCCNDDDPISANLYSAEETAGLPPAAIRASLGCGNPSALAQLQPGEVVLDLGAGGGIDVLLSARRVAPTGKAYGLDMTDEMLELARDNQRRAEMTNAEFLKGELEAIPLPDGSVDVVISNCVVNLSPDKRQALREAFRVLKPGGRFAVSDIVLEEGLSTELRSDATAWDECVAGALDEGEYRGLLAAAGFERVEIEPTRTHRAGVMSAFVRARKP